MLDQIEIRALCRKIKFQPKWKQILVHEAVVAQKDVVMLKQGKIFSIFKRKKQSSSEIQTPIQTGLSIFIVNVTESRRLFMK